MRKAVCCVTAGLVLACAACNKTRIYPVSGKVMYNGFPASGATVFFCRQGGDTRNEQLILGVVQADGSFELVCGSLGKGAPPGKYDVVIDWQRVRGQGRSQNVPAKLKGRYSDRQHPLLNATVEARATTLPTFELSEGNPHGR